MSTPKSLTRTKRPISTPKVRSAFKSPVLNRSPASVITTDQLRQQILELLDKEKLLDDEITVLENDGCREEELQAHIEKLHEYNEIKDVAQMVMGRIAEIDGVTTREIHEKYGVGSED